MGSELPRLKEQSRLTQVTRRSVGVSVFGRSLNECRLNFVATPRAFFQRDRGRFSIVIHERDCLRSGGLAIRVAFLSHPVWGRGTADPEADFKRPFAQFIHVLLAFQFQGADQRRGTAKLVKRKQPERVPHQDAQSRRSHARMLQATQDDRERCQSKVGFGLTAARGEEEQIDDFTICVQWDRRSP